MKKIDCIQRTYRVNEICKVNKDNYYIYPAGEGLEPVMTIHFNQEMIKGVSESDLLEIVRDRLKDNVNEKEEELANALSDIERALFWIFKYNVSKKTAEMLAGMGDVK